MAEIRTFKGRPALPGDVQGSAEVSHIGFNTCATYVDVMISGTKSGVCQDHDNKDLFGRDLADKVVCVPQTIGSSSAACLFMTICEKDIAPKAMLFANHIDSLAACGLLMADNWIDKRIVTVDLLGPDFLNTVMTGNTIRVHADGTVEVHG
ncbi:MAG: aconitase X swivel domain-containing protein [Filomicrobium sp.]